MPEHNIAKFLKRGSLSPSTRELFEIAQSLPPIIPRQLTKECWNLAWEDYVTTV